MAWVIDLDGVVWIGDTPIAGAAEAVESLRARGEEVLFVTNMSGRTRAGHEEKLARHGIDAAGAVVSSAMAAARLVAPGERVMAFAGLGVHEALSERGVELVDSGPADAVVVGYHVEFDYDAMARAAAAVRDGARFVGTNHDPTLPTSAGLMPGAGAILAGVAVASGVEPIVAGKPNRPMVDTVRARLGAEATGTVVGDRPDSDGAFARALGFRFALVLSGVTGPDDDPEPVPDVVAESIASLVAALE